MATSYPRRDSASGIWKISDITSNKLTEGTWPSSASTRGLSAGGDNPSNVNVIEYITVATAGNATDFGDLTTLLGFQAGAASRTRGLWG